MHFDATTGQMAPDATDPVAPAAVPPAIAAPAIPPPVAAVPGAIPGLETMQQTITGPSTSGKVITKDIRQADKDSAAALDAEKKAAEDQRQADLKADEAKAAEEAIAHAKKVQQAQDAQAEVTRRQTVQQKLQQKVDSDVARETDEYQKNQRGFFGDDKAGGSTASKILWGLSLAFGAGAVRYGQPNQGFQLLDKSIEDWSNERRQNLAFLAKKAEKSGGQLAEWMNQYGPEAENTLKLREAAAYTGLADQMTKLLEQHKSQMSAETQAKYVAKIADLQTKASIRKQDVATARAPEFHSGQSSTLVVDPLIKNPNAGKAGAGRAQGTQIQKATLYEKGQDSLNTIDRLTKEGVQLTEDDRRRIQNNRAELERAKHMGLIELKTMRGLGQVARSPYDGLDGKKAELARANDLVTQVGAAVTSPSTAENEIEHGRQLFDLNAPGLTPNDRHATLGHLRGAVNAAKILAADKANGLIEPGEGQAPASRSITPADQPLLNQALATKPGDPAYNDAQRWLRAHGR